MGAYGLRARAEPVELRIELSVGEIPHVLMRPAQSKPCLADAAHATDHGDCGCVLIGVRERLRVQQGQRGASTDEHRWAGGELAGDASGGFFYALLYALCYVPCR